MLILWKWHSPKVVIWAAVECKSTYMWYYFLCGGGGLDSLFSLASTQQLLFWQVLHVCTYPRAFWESNWTIAHRKYGVSPPPPPSSSWTMDMWWGLFLKNIPNNWLIWSDGPNKLWNIWDIPVDIWSLCVPNLRELNSLVLSALVHDFSFVNYYVYKKLDF